MESAFWGVIIGSLIGGGVSIFATFITQRSARKQALEQHIWELRSQTYVELLSWTGWVEHWYLSGSPDKHERPYTVEMARIAAKLSAFDGAEAGEKARQLLTDLGPYVSRQDISGKPPPPPHIRTLAQELNDHAQRRVTNPTKVG